MSSGQMLASEPPAWYPGEAGSFGCHPAFPTTNDSWSPAMKLACAFLIATLAVRRSRLGPVAWARSDRYDGPAAQTRRGDHEEQRQGAGRHGRTGRRPVRQGVQVLVRRVHRAADLHRLGQSQGKLGPVRRLQLLGQRRRFQDLRRAGVHRRRELRAALRLLLPHRLHEVGQGQRGLERPDPGTVRPAGRRQRRLRPQPLPQRLGRQVVLLAAVAGLLLHDRADGSGEEDPAATRPTIRPSKRGHPACWPSSRPSSRSPS